MDGNGTMVVFFASMSSDMARVYSGEDNENISVQGTGNEATLDSFDDGGRLPTSTRLLRGTSNPDQTFIAHWKTERFVLRTVTPCA